MNEEWFVFFLSLPVASVPNGHYSPQAVRIRHGRMGLLSGALSGLQTLHGALTSAPFFLAEESSDLL